MSLLLVTGACGMIVGARGWPGTTRFLLTLLGLALACGGASALNNLLDRDIDRLMGERTSQRPVAAGRLGPPRGRRSTSRPKASRCSRSSTRRFTPRSG